MTNFTIPDLKRALVEVKKICDNNRCVNCPFHKTDEANIPYCPMHEDDDGISIHQPAFWVIGDYEEDAHGSQTD